MQALSAYFRYRTANWPDWSGRGLFAIDGTVTGLTPGVRVCGLSPGLTRKVGGATPNPDGSFQFTAQLGPILQTVVIETTTNLTDSNSWAPIATFLPGSSPFTFTDTNASQFGLRFYRVIAP